MAASAAAAPSINHDAGDIAIIEDSDGVVARQNQFNLDQKTLLFAPSGGSAAQYRYSVSEQGYDSAAAEGKPLAALDDDDYRAIDLPFSFPFFGAVYNRAYVNSDGNLTFTAPEYASTDRSLGRMTAGPPRISPLFDDLNPAATAGGVRVLSSAARLVVSWVAVPEWQATGTGPAQTFQVRLYPDGRIEFSYSGYSSHQRRGGPRARQSSGLDRAGGLPQRSERRVFRRRRGALRQYARSGRRHRRPEVLPDARRFLRLPGDLQQHGYPGAERGRGGIREHRAQQRHGLRRPGVRRRRAVRLGVTAASGHEHGIPAPVSARSEQLRRGAEGAGRYAADGAGT